MAWLRIDDRVRTHPKIAEAGPSAAWLWFCGICYCREHLTDGFIPKSAVSSLAMNLQSPWRHARRLVEVKLWEDALGGYQVHDFLDWNPSKADVIATRATEQDRKQRERSVSGRRPAGHLLDNERTDNGVQPVSSYTRAGDAGLGSPLGSGGGDRDLGEESAREGELAPRWVQAPARRDSPLVGRHHGCFSLTPSACARGICVPNWLGQQWRQQYGDELGQADRDIRAVVEAAVAALPATGPIGDEPKQFWLAVWKAAHGSQAPQASMGRGQLTLDAAKRVALARLHRSGRAS